MVAVKLDAEPHQVIRGPEFGAWLARIDPSITTTVSYNSLFDNSILAWKYGWVPDRMYDAMGMARCLIGHELHSFSLNSVAAHLGFGTKGQALKKVEGLMLAQIESSGMYEELAAYAVQDNYLCEMIYNNLYPAFPWAERRLMDMVLRCCVQPRFVTDVDMLRAHLDDVRLAKQMLLEAANNIDPKIVMSTPRFKEWLEARGVDVTMKLGPSGNEVPAFAKTDEFMETLQDHEDDEVAAAASARLALKSTLEETRTEKLLSIAELDWGPYFAPHSMPIPLRYGAAHTHRLGGEWKMNMQNMPTVRGSKGKSKLRQSLLAPEGHVVLTCDLSQIEARLAAWICGCTRLVTEFEQKLDPYSQLATDIFGYPVNRKAKNPDGTLIFPIEGFIGKTGILGLGYGAGKERFHTMVMQSARKDGLDLTGKYDRVLGDKAVDSYRRRYWQIRDGWGRLDGHLHAAFLSGSACARFGPVEISYGTVTLPSGLMLKYADPRVQVDGTGRPQIRYRYGKMWHSLYGAKLLENIVQALARIVVMNAALRIRDRGKLEANASDYRFVLQAHDELVYIVKEERLDEVRTVVMQEMTRRPSWAKDAPIDAECGVGANYGEAK
jgi:DNA polymerase